MFLTPELHGKETSLANNAGAGELSLCPPGRPFLVRNS